MDSEMGHLCDLRILIAAVKNDNFQLKYFVVCFFFLFCSEHRLWTQTHVRAKIRKMCTTVKSSCTI